MKEYLLQHPGSKDITVLRFSLNDKNALQDIAWENSHEFWYHGEIFDLVETKTENHELVIRCINDKNESKLVHLQEKINKETQGNASSRNRDASLIHLVQTAFIVSDFTEKASHPSGNSFVIRDDFYTSFLYHTVLTPPPQFS